MKIEKLNIDGFGVFREKKIEGFSKGINLLYGANEAGKSTLLDFIRFTLFGYPRYIAERRSPINGGKHGGKIWLENTAGQSFSIYRSGNAKDVQLEYQGNVYDNEKKYLQLISNASIDLYQNIYGITLDELNSVEQLGKSGMEDRIFSMGMGLSGVNFGEFEKKLIDSSLNYYKPSGKVQVLSELVNEIQKKEEVIGQLHGKLDEYNRYSEQEDRLDEEIKELEKSRNNLSEEVTKLTSWAKAYPEFVNYDTAAEKMKELGEIENHPVQILEQYNENKRKLNDEKSALAKLTQELEQIEDEIQSLKWDEQLSKQADLLDFFKRNIKLYEEASAKKNHEIERSKNAENKIEEILDRLGNNQDKSQLIALEGTFELQTEATQIGEQQQKLERNIESKNESLNRLNQEFSELKKKKDKIENELRTHSIQNKEQRKNSNHQKVALEVELETVFKSALGQTGGTNKSKLPLILVVIFLVVGGALFAVNTISGGIVLGIAVISLIVVLLQKDKSPGNFTTIVQNPNEIKLNLDKIVSAIQRFDLLDNECQEIGQQFSFKQEEINNTKEDLDSLKNELENLMNNWKELLQKNKLPSTLIPSRMVNFISNVEEIKRQNALVFESQQAIQNIEKQISDFEEKLRNIIPEQNEIELSEVYALISKMEENEKNHLKREQFLQQRNTAINGKELKFENISRLESENIQLFEQIKVNNEIAFYQHFELQQSLNEQKEKLANASNNIKVLCGVNQLDETLQSLKELTTSELNSRVETTRNDYENVKKQYDEMNKEWATIQTEIRHILEIDDMYAAQNQKESLQTQLKEETKEWLTIKLALEILNQSKQKYEKEKQPEVITNTRDVFRKITDNSYEDLRISLSEKHVSIIDAAGNSKTVEELSRGTKEQLLLSLRLGLIAEYEKDAEPLPVVFDDIMVNFDTDRTRKLAQILTDFSAERQLIYFTCHPHTKELFKEYGANVIEW